MYAAIFLVLHIHHSYCPHLFQIITSCINIYEVIRPVIVYCSARYGVSCFANEIVTQWLKTINTFIDNTHLTDCQ